MGGVVPVAYEGFLVREACICVLVDGAGLFLWSAMKCPVMRCQWVWSDFGLPVY